MENTEFTVHDRLGPLRFKGYLLSDKRWDIGRNVRWTDMALYAVTDMAHDKYLRVRVECEGCTPARSLLVEQHTLDEGSLMCGPCGKPFVPTDDQEEQPVRYALEITARSRVYHRPESACVKSKHRLKTVAQVRADPGNGKTLEPCHERGCSPAKLADLRPNDRIAVERDDPQIYLCTSAPALLNKLYRRNGEITILAAKLLKEAAANDADIAAAMTSRRRI